MSRFLATLALCLLLSIPAQAVPIIGRSVLGQGGGSATLGTLSLGSTVGECIIGYGQTGTLNGWMGFWIPIASQSAVTEQSPETAHYFLEINHAIITYGVGADRPVMIRLGIYDVRGRLIRELVTGVQSPGIYSLNWNSTTSTGLRVASGLYFLSLRAGNVAQTRKFVVFN